MSAAKTIPLDGDVRFLALVWDEPAWEFDRPVVLLEPVLRYAEDDDPESIIENAAFEIEHALTQGEPVSDEDLERMFDWRGYRVDYLKRVARQVLAGKEFPIRNYSVTESVFQFHRQPDGTVEFQEIGDTQRP